MTSQIVKWPKIILFGDSITQHSFDPKEGMWGALLADRLQRICDVVTRGFSGYNSRFCRQILPKVFSTENVSDISAFVILVGTNDCSGNVSLENPTVPLVEYQENLRAMIVYLEEIGISKEKIILMTPPPYCHEKYAAFCEKIGRVLNERDMSVIAQYAAGCVDVAKSLDVEVVNLFQEMQKDKDWDRLLIDGVHLARDGSELVFELLWPSINRRVDDKMLFPYWRDFDA